jgi:hypothetical protein
MYSSLLFHYLLFLHLAGTVGANLRQIIYTKPNKEHGIQDIIEDQQHMEWNFYAVFEGVDPRKRQELALVSINHLL